MTRRSGAVDDTAAIAAGAGGTLLLATALLELVICRRRRRAERGIDRDDDTSVDTPTVERAIAAAADVPLARWAGQALAQMVADFDTRNCAAVPVAVELSEEHGLEVLWSEPTNGAAEGWTAVEGGWSWTLPYDPEAPTPHRSPRS